VLQKFKCPFMGGGVEDGTTALPETKGATFIV